MKKIYIAPTSKGWIILTDQRQRLSGFYGSPQQALDIARAFVTHPDMEIIIHPGAEGFDQRRDQRRDGMSNRQSVATRNHK